MNGLKKREQFLKFVILLSYQKINKTFLAFSSLAKLSDKSHYNYNEIDIIKN